VAGIDALEELRAEAAGAGEGTLPENHQIPQDKMAPTSPAVANPGQP